MRGEEKLSALIGDIYDAALDPSRWEAVLTKSADFVQGAGAALWGRSLNPASNPYYDVGVSPHYKKLYFEEYFRLDPLGVAYFFLDVGEVISSSDIVPALLQGVGPPARVCRQRGGPAREISDQLCRLRRLPP